MNAPMILPWVAHKAGISQELTLKLWRRAASESELRLGSCRGQEYYRLVNETFLSLVEDESCAEPCLSVPSLAWAWRQQHRISRLSMMAAQNLWNEWIDAWQDCIRSTRLPRPA